MDELLAEIMRRVEEYWADSPEGPYCRQEIVNGVREILDDLKADAARIVDRAAELVMDDVAGEVSDAVDRALADSALAPVDLTAEPTAYVFLQPGWQERLAELAPRADEPHDRKTG